MKTLFISTLVAGILMSGSAFAFDIEKATWDEIIAQPVTSEGFVITPDMSMGDMLKFSDAYNAQVPGKYKSYINFPELGAIVSLGPTCDLMMTQEDVIVWLKASILAPELDNTKFFAKNRCPKDGTQPSTTVEAMEAHMRSLTVPHEIVDGEGNSTIVPPVITSDDAKGKTGISYSTSDGNGGVNDVTIQAFDFASECSGYKEKFWEWRISKCEAAQPGWKAPALGHKISS